jgi:hypothetical protein
MTPQQERRALLRELREIARDYPDGGSADVMADRRRAIVNRLDELRQKSPRNAADARRRPGDATDNELAAAGKLQRAAAALGPDRDRARAHRRRQDTTQRRPQLQRQPEYDFAVDI